MWKTLRELDAKANDPSRFVNRWDNCKYFVLLVAGLCLLDLCKFDIGMKRNLKFWRGGALLKDQNMHNYITKTLPKLEADIVNLAQKFENEHGKKMKISGEEIPVLIEKEWKLFKEERGKKSSRTGPSPAKSTPLVRRNSISFKSIFCRLQDIMFMFVLFVRRPCEGLSHQMFQLHPKFAR